MLSYYHFAYIHMEKIKERLGKCKGKLLTKIFLDFKNVLSNILNNQNLYYPSLVPHVNEYSAVPAVHRGHL